MANRIDIDPRLIVPWTTGTQYRIAVTQGLVVEEGNNRSPSPAIGNSKTFTTPGSGPTVASTSPAVGATAVANTATISYIRPVYATTGTTNFYLYRQTTGTSDLLVATIPNTSTRITRVGKNVTISFRDLLVPNFTHYLTADQGIYTDLFNFASPAITTSTIFNYIPGPGADILTVTPSFGATNQFHNKVNVTYNKNISRINSGSYYLNYESSGTIRTFSLTSSSVVVTSTTSNVQITFDNMVLPEGNYFITNDGGIFTDQHNFPYPEVFDDSKIKWFNTSISNMNTLRYRGETPTAIFTTTNPRVLDIDLNTATQYTFTLSAPIGTFSSTQGGTSTSGVWTFTGTKTQINNLIESIIFTTNQQENPPTTYTYSLSKNGVTLVNKTKDLIGILLLLGAPGPTGKAFPRLTLSLAGTNVIDETVTMTANISTNTVLAGVVEFKSGNTVLSTATISSGGVASITTTFPSTGTRFLSASWLGGQLPTDGFIYEPLDSFDTQVNIAAAQRLPSDPVIGFTNLTTLRVPVGPDLEIRGTLPISGLGGEITFNQITEVTTATTTPTPVNITIQSTSASGVNFPPAGAFESTEAWAITVNNTSTIAAGDYLKITGTMTGLGVISGLYRVSRIVGSTIYFDARSESDNIYYWYDPIRDSLSGVTVTFDPIQFIATIPSTGKFRTSSQAIGTSTVVGSTALLTTSFTTTGTYLLSADWSGRVTAPKYFPQVSGSTQLIVTDRADYPVPLVLSGPTYVHQLRSPTYTLTSAFTTATTGTLELTSFNAVGGEQDVFITTLNSSTINFSVDTSDLIAGFNSIQAFWEGQAWVPNTFFPYYGTATNLINVDYQVGSLQIATTSRNTVFLPTSITAIANTSTADTGTVSFFDGATLLATTSTNNNSATITLSSGTLAVGTHNITAVWNNTTPAVTSTIFVNQIVSRDISSVDIALSSSTYMLYNQDNTSRTQSLTATITVSGPYAGEAPSGQVNLSDLVSGVISTATLSVGTGTSSIASITWVPIDQGQLPGVRTMQSVYGADNWNDVGTGTRSLTILKPTTSTTLTLASDNNFRTLGNTTFTVTKSSDATLLSAIEFRNQSTDEIVGTANFVDNTATLVVQVLPAGAFSWRAVYQEDTYHAVSTSTTVQQTIIKVRDPITFTSTIGTTYSAVMPNGRTGLVVAPGDVISATVTATNHPAINTTTNTSRQWNLQNLTTTVTNNILTFASYDQTSSSTQFTATSALVSGAEQGYVTLRVASSEDEFYSSTSSNTTTQFFYTPPLPTTLTWQTANLNWQWYPVPTLTRRGQMGIVAGGAFQPPGEPHFKSFVNPGGSTGPGLTVGIRSYTLTGTNIWAKNDKRIFIRNQVTGVLSTVTDTSYVGTRTLPFSSLSHDTDYPALGLNTFTNAIVVPITWSTESDKANLATSSTYNINVVWTDQRWTFSSDLIVYDAPTSYPYNHLVTTRLVEAGRFTGNTTNSKKAWGLPVYQGVSLATSSLADEGKIGLGHDFDISGRTGTATVEITGVTGDTPQQIGLINYNQFITISPGVNIPNGEWMIAGAVNYTGPGTYTFNWQGQFRQFNSSFGYAGRQDTGLYILVVLDDRDNITSTIFHTNARVTLT
jgi:hypothetical protein